MKFYFVLLVLLLIFGCAEKKLTFDDLEDIPATGETGSLVYENPHTVALEKGTDVGKLAPDFSVQTTSGKNITLSKLGKPAIIYFWATWCPYCTQDFANVASVYPKYNDSVEFLAINMDLKEGKDKIIPYEQRKGTPGMLFAPGYQSMLREYSITHTTTKLALDKNGVILWKGSGVMNSTLWDKLLYGARFS